MSRLSVLFVALILSASAASAQPSAVVIRGRIVAEADNRPLRRALVRQARVNPRAEARSVLTDEDGRFEIELPDSSAELIVGKAGYTSIVVTPDRNRRSARELEIRLARGAALWGRVVEPGGAPAVGARVMARRIDDPNPTATYEAETDELGDYRLGGLAAGTYLMTAGNSVLIARTSDPIALRELMQGIVVRDRLVFPGLTPGLTGPTRMVEVRAGEETGDVDLQSAPDPLLVTPPRAALPEGAKIVDRPEGRIAGRVVTPLGQPVANARVVIAGNNRSSMTVTDANGRFDVRGFPDGDYRIETARFGFTQPGPVPLTNPLEQENGGTVRRLHVGGDSRVHDIDLVLSPGGVISGAIVDSAGEPFQGVMVRPLRLRHDGGRTVATSASLPRLTDDRGRYRVYGLPPGSYLIVATIDASEPPAGRTRATGFAPVYYPGTAHVESAQQVPVELGSEISGVDLAVAVTSTVRVAGTALNAAGDPLAGRVSLGVTHRSGSVAPEPRFVQITAEGAFELANVPPGDYVLQVHGEPGPGTRAEFGAEYITIGENDSPPLKIKTSPGSTLEGRFVHEAGASMPMRAQSIHAASLDLDLSPPGGRGPQGLSVHDDGRFYLTGLYGSMRLSYPASPGWYVKSVTIGGLDVTDRTFDFGYGSETFSEAEIVLSSAGASIEGSIASSGRRGEGVAVVAFPVDRTNWFTGSRYLKRATVSLDRSFDIDDLPPGEYFVAAVETVPPGDWQSPGTLDAHVQGAARVTVRESQVEKVTLRLRR